MLAAVILGCVLVLQYTSAQNVFKPAPLWNWTYTSSSYIKGPPPQCSNNVNYNGMNSCNGFNGDHNAMSFACPHMMLLSPDMQFAAARDGIDSWAVYGVASYGTNYSTCGMCFQLEITEEGSKNTWPEGVHKYVIQVISQSHDVNQGEFEIFVGGGGLGYYDSCSTNCKAQGGKTCDGGPCNSAQYEGDFSTWTAPDDDCYGGGVQDPKACDELVNWQQNTFAETTLVYGCKDALYRGYHQNFQVRYKRVICPNTLVNMTGIRRVDDMPPIDKPHGNLELPETGKTSTMMDCCKPTCVSRQNVQQVVETDPNWPQVFPCDKNGYPILNGQGCFHPENC